MGNSMIARRTLLAVAATIPFCKPAAVFGAGGDLPVPPSRRLSFRLLRDDSEIGLHTITFDAIGDTLAVLVDVNVLVKLGPIPVFRYTHRAIERWQGRRYLGLESRTDHDGEPNWMRAVTTDAGLVVEGSKAPRYIAPPGVFGTTYWNQDMLRDQVIGSEDGRLFTIRRTALDIEPIPLATGGTIPARHYNIAGGLQLDLWYDTVGQWAHLAFTRYGATVIYQKL
jgi:hypothetical protein